MWGGEWRAARGGRGGGVIRARSSSPMLSFMPQIRTWPEWGERMEGVGRRSKGTLEKNRWLSRAAPRGWLEKYWWAAFIGSIGGDLGEVKAAEVCPVPTLFEAEEEEEEEEEDEKTRAAVAMTRACSFCERRKGKRVVMM